MAATLKMYIFFFVILCGQIIMVTHITVIRVISLNKNKARKNENRVDSKHLMYFLYTSQWYHEIKLYIISLMIHFRILVDVL